MRKSELVHVIPVFRRGAVPYIIRDLQPFVGQRYKVTILALQSFVDDVELVDEFRQIGIQVHSLDCHRLDVLGASVRLWCFLRRYKPDVIHAHLGRALMLSSTLAPRNVPVFGTLHGPCAHYHTFTKWTLGLIKTGLRH